MLKLHCSDLWDVITSLSSSSAHRHAAVAYVTDDSNLRFGKGDTLIVDASHDAIQTRQTSAKVLMKAYRHGAELFSCPDLHAKVMVFDRTAVIGSANLSRSSVGRLLEAAVVTDNMSMVSAARNVLAQLKLQSRKLNEKALKALLRIRVIGRGFPKSRRKGRPPVVKPMAGTTWLAATADLNEERYKHEEQRVKRGSAEARKRVSHPSSDVESIRYAKNSNVALRANEGDWFIDMYETGRGNTVRVYRRAPILLKQKEPNCVRIYVEDFRNAESEALKWRTFHKIARQAGIPDRRMGRQSTGTLTDSQAEALESFWQLALSRTRRNRK